MVVVRNIEQRRTEYREKTVEVERQPAASFLSGNFSSLVTHKYFIERHVDNHNRILSAASPTFLVRLVARIRSCLSYLVSLLKKMDNVFTL